jgi:DNA-binding protein H-NS
MILALQLWSITILFTKHLSFSLILDYEIAHPRTAREQNKVKSMRDSQLEKMSLKDLTSLHAKVQAAIDEKRISERSEMRSKMEEMARASGFSVAELFGRKGKNGSKGIAKYRNPKDHTQTWTGRGRRPLWMSAAGGDHKRFLIAS